MVQMSFHRDQLGLPVDSGLGVGGWGRWGRRRLEGEAKDRSGKRRPPGKAECSPRIFC